MDTASGRELDEADLALAGFCQYCGVGDAHAKSWRCEFESIDGGRLKGRTRVFYACGLDHFESAVREESVAEIRELLDAPSGTAGVERGATNGPPDPGAQGVPSSPPGRTIEWRVMDRYCWSCGTHGALFESTTPCSKCGERQRLYLRERGQTGAGTRGSAALT
jgi:hypothetical protein